MFRMVAPHVGMALLTAVYTLAGAMVFYTIKAPNEKLLREHGVCRVGLGGRYPTPLLALIYSVGIPSKLHCICRSVNLANS